MAAKKPAKKAAKATRHVLSKARRRAEGKTSKPAARKAAVKKPVAKKPLAKKTATRKPLAKRTVAKKPVAKKPAAKKPVAKKPVAKQAPARKAPAKKAPAKSAAARKPAPKAAAMRKPMSAKAPATRSLGREALVGPVKVQTPKPPPTAKTAAAPVPKPVTKPVARPVAKELAQQAARVARPIIAPRPVGKVAVAVAAKPTAPARKGKIKVVPYKTDETTRRPILPAGYKPSVDEEYMGPLQTEYFRQRLFSWRADLVEESKQTIENLKDEVRDVGDEAERATRETENSLELRTRDRYRKLIGKIDSTLQRLDVGEYGYSVDSGEEIGLERLEARLTAERTIDEQERWEHLQKQIGD
ncbi:MAG: RNA polymerase-binding protein DksA [Luteimonas sp.]